MSSPATGDNTPPQPQDGGNAGGGDLTDQVMADQPWEDLAEDGNEEGGAAVGAQNLEWLDEEVMATADEYDEYGSWLGEEEDTNDGVQGQQNATGVGDEHTEEEDVAALTRPVTAGWIKLDGRYDANETFVPLPAVTFVIDQPENLTCRLCLVSELRVSHDDVEVTDRTPALMPCGHIAGAVCLNEAIESMEPEAMSCPFCRYPLTYADCGHRVPEKALTIVTIRRVPATVPNGGVVPPRCLECSILRVQWQYSMMLSDAKTDFVVARANYVLNRTEEAARRLARFSKLFERLPEMESSKISRIRCGIGSW